MPTINVVNMAGSVVGTMEISDVLFGGEVNGTVLHAAVRAYLLNQRQGTQSTLTRSEVSGGGRKPWRQKGTGRARQGSTRSPQWTHGGIALGPKPRSYHTDLNKKTKRLALISALTDKFNSGNLIVVDDIALESYKTKTMVDMFKALGCEKTVVVKYKDAETRKQFEEAEAQRKANQPKVRFYKEREAKVMEDVLVVLPEVNSFVVKSCNNIPSVKTCLYNTINVYDIMNADKFVTTAAAIKLLEEVYA